MLKMPSRAKAAVFLILVSAALVLLVRAAMRGRGRAMGGLRCPRSRDAPARGPCILDILSRDDKGRVSVRDSQPTVLVLSWVHCGHCRVLEPHWQDAVGALRPDIPRVAWLEYGEQGSPDNVPIDCLGRWGLHDNRFPRILFWRRGGCAHEVYEGERSKEALESLLRDLMSEPAGRARRAPDLGGSGAAPSQSG